MKRFYKIIWVAALALTMPFSFILGQDKKSEQKIKIIVTDGSGTKVIIDTVFTGDNGPDSLLLKDGSVVYMKHPGIKGKNHYSITYSSDKKEGGQEFKEMTVISSDSSEVNDLEHGNVMYYRNDPSGGHHRYKVISHSSGDGNEMIYVNKARHDMDEEQDSDSGIDKTRFVIAKDGMVVTVEGTDEAKAKELVKEIQKSLGVTEKEENKEVPKTKSGKVTK